MHDVTGTRLLMGRYKVSYDHPLGSGSFANLYKALDLVDVKTVAVKVFKEGDGDAKKAETFRMFQQSVTVMRSLCRPSGQQVTRSDSFDTDTLEEDLARRYSGKECDMMQFMKKMDLGMCFIQLLGYSKDSWGHPGVDPDTEMLYLVTELGEESLADFFKRRAERNETLLLDELRILQWGLVSIVCGLHSAGYVHLDIKPNNIMRIGNTWKLIDFDGAVKTKTCQRLDNLTFTPLYMAPELAQTLVKAADGVKLMPNKKKQLNANITVSRTMDIWSLGMCALEAVFLVPVLEPWYTQWHEETGCESKFLKWLADYKSRELVEGDMKQAMEEIHPDMADLVVNMLSKDPEYRHSITHCLVHRWFEPISHNLWQEILSPRSMTMVAVPTMMSRCETLNHRASMGPRPSKKGRHTMMRMSATSVSKACAVM